MKSLLSLALATLLIGTALPAMAEDGPPSGGPGGPGGPGKERGAKMFEEADLNKDGELTKEEMLGAHQKRLDKMFTDLDTDKNGTLSKPELEKGRTKMREALKERFKDVRKNGPGRDGPPSEQPQPQGEKAE